MPNDQKLYIAGMGMITALGPTLSTTVAAVRAGKSAYVASHYVNNDRQIIMARVPDIVFEQVRCELIEEGDVFNSAHERMLRMAVVASRESTRKCNSQVAIPLLLSLPEHSSSEEHLTPFIPALAHNLTPWIQPAISRRFAKGRAAGLEALDFAFKYLMDQPQDYLLVVGVDSYDDDTILNRFSERLLTSETADAFAPGEGACALLLTRHQQLAEHRNGAVIAIHPPGLAEEEGHMFSSSPYRGDGLAEAFRRALTAHPNRSIDSIYSSMNGENHWSKEYGVAYLRNKEKFAEPINTEHPADCYGDLGAATGPALIALAAENLHKMKNVNKHLIYSSADKATRGAVVVEKIIAPTQG